MTDSDKPAATTQKALSSTEADVTKYKVRLSLESTERKLTPGQTAADIVHLVMKKLVELSVEGAKVIDLCLEGDKLIEKGTGAVFNKAVKGVKVNKGTLRFF